MFPNFKESTAGGMHTTTYIFENIGDDVPIHHHTYDHTCIVGQGKVFCYNENGGKEYGVTEIVLFKKGVNHGIRAVEANTIVYNVSLNSEM
jgi:quercetin dioxygenase-like cupin family protein